ncbi:hypothetical protein D3879_22805 [Pseudomonas cavernicola]|uniref:Uncharacterized protein n=1 Tax=Pseudomonas cavernicola TaxID=2320866 RepID=A0A418XAA3_9PSED|nr:hypothetical protein [Pseudomonas cavernicola]RJG09293.1 hypothetical protein D3879_22805 [Pseudomonas cavernicola]
MSRPARNLRKTLDSVAANNEAAAIEVMRAIDQLGDELLRQRLLNVVHRLNQDSGELRLTRDEVQGVSFKLA